MLERTRVPIDEFAVAAALESEGIRDLDARTRFGNTDVFDLARDVFGACLERAAAVAAPSERPTATERRAAVKRFFRYYGLGVLFALPILLQVGTVITVRVSNGFTDAQATAVMVGSILSFLATGGFSQAIGRLGSTYTSRSAYHLARPLIWRMIRMGLIAALVTGALWMILAVTLEPFPLRIAVMALEYHLALSWLWLSLAVLYMLEKRFLVIAMAVIWLGIFGILAGVVGTSIEVAQLPGYLVAAAVATVISWRLLRRLERSTPASALQERLPRDPILLHGTAAYFVYGVLYFCLLFADRVVSWSANPPDGFLFYFERRYELGLDWALLSLVLTIAVLEYTIHEFADVIEPVQKRFTVHRLRQHNRAFLRFYLRQLGLLFAVGLGSGLVVYWGVTWASVPGRVPGLDGLFTAPLTERVFFFGVAAYGLLAVALMNAVVLFFLSRPRGAVAGLTSAIVVTVGVGLVLSRVYEPWTSAIGLLAGAGTFALVTGIAALRVVRNMDYYYYASY